MVKWSKWSEFVAPLPEVVLSRTGILANAFELRPEAKGIPVGPHNLPDGDGTREGLHLCLRGLYQITPPAELIIDGASIFAATQQYPARRGMLAPQHVALVCGETDRLIIPR